MKSIEKTIEEWYGGVAYDINKADAPLLTSTTGSMNVIYGAYAFAQYNNNSMALGYLPKFEAPKSGWRVMTAIGGTAGDGGVAENGAVPDSIKPTIAEVSANPKDVAHHFQVSTRDLHQIGKDDMFGGEDFFLKWEANKHAKGMNEQILKNVTTVAGNSLESIDRVCSSYAEVTNCADVHANDSDIYGQDRDAAASWADANVDENADVNRALTLGLIRDLKRDCITYAANPSFFLTGPDTLSQIEGLVETTTRYTLGHDKVAPSANGLQTQGIEGGVEVASLFGLPVVTDADVVVDGSSRIYCLDTHTEAGIPTLGLGMWKRTEMFQNKNIAISDVLTNDYVYYTSAELYCFNFRKQGKIRDISA